MECIIWKLYNLIQWKGVYYQFYSKIYGLQEKIDISDFKVVTNSMNCDNMWI